MNPATIINEAAADGVRLTLSPTGTIKVTGDSAAINYWTPIIREQKPAIVKALLERAACAGELPAIRTWLSFIGETDPATIADVLDRCHADAEARDYFTRQAGEMK